MRTIYLFILKIKALIEEFLWNTKEVCSIIIRFFIGLIFSAIDILRYIIFKILLVIMTITNIGFFIGLILLIFNIKESIQGVNFFDTRYFGTMIILIVTHIVLMIISIFIKPKEY